MRLTQMFDLRHPHTHVPTHPRDPRDPRAHATHAI